MKTLRSKIFLFVAFLLLLPAIPLSVFIMNLLDRSYRIGVNADVESALDGGLYISAEYYQLQKSRLTETTRRIFSEKRSDSAILQALHSEFPQSTVAFLSDGPHYPDRPVIPDEALSKFRTSGQDYIIWPSADRMTLYALTRLGGNRILAVKYPLPAEFREAAKNVQEVSQIYKTLGMVNSEIRRSFLYTFLVIYGFGILLALLVSYYISYKMTLPIQKLIGATKEIASGNLDYRIQTTENDEFRTLSDAFNQMVAELKENQRKIIELEKMATWQQMARRLAHEIKNPLTPIQLMAQQIVDKYTGSDKAYLGILKESYQIIEQEVDSLKNLVRAFSDFARLPEFQPAQHDLGHLLTTLQKMYQQADIRLEISPDSYEYFFDYDHLKRALINVIDNALAAQNGSGPVSIALEKIEQSIQIRISDQGTGIHEKDLDKIFEPYFSTKQTGVGLGLAIVKKIIEEHGGQISVISEIEKGTTFLIDLPLKTI